jgi:hypothetical protein
MPLLKNGISWLPLFKRELGKFGNHPTNWEKPMEFQWRIVARTRSFQKRLVNSKVVSGG